jgi:hypothetical protein
MNLSTAHLSKQYQVVGRKRLAYNERGGGDAIVFLPVLSSSGQRYPSG